MKWLADVIIQWFLGKIGLSSDQKLGRAEEVNKQQAQTIQDVRLANEICDNVNKLDSGNAARILHAKYQDK